MHVRQVQRTLAAANESGWIISPRRAKRASGEGTAGEHIMDLVKELVERSLTESAPSREHGRADLMRNSLADLDGDEPSTPSGSPTRSGVRPAETASTRPSEFAHLRQALLLPCLYIVGASYWASASRSLCMFCQHCKRVDSQEIPQKMAEVSADATGACPHQLAHRLRSRARFLSRNGCGERTPRHKQS